MSQIYNDKDAATRYDTARALPKGTSKLWMDKLKQLLPLGSIQKILDLGCGTGRFVPALQATFNCPIIAVDPSVEMLNQGKARRHEEVSWVQGTAEHIPLADNAVDLVWICQVYHHLDMPEDAFHEIRRVLTLSGCVVIRNGTLENEAENEWSHCFPEAQKIDCARLPSQKQVIDFVSNMGFESFAKETIYQYFAASYQEYYDKIAERGLSSLISISDEAFLAGLERLKRWIAEKPDGKPVYEPVDLFIFRVIGE
jgi:ubiquinone/menaquinone biosynthesis C-methylase UbiE